MQGGGEGVAPSWAGEKRGCRGGGLRGGRIVCEWEGGNCKGMKGDALHVCAGGRDEWKEGRAARLAERVQRKHAKRGGGKRGKNVQPFLSHMGDSECAKWRREVWPGEVHC